MVRLTTAVLLASLLAGAAFAETPAYIRAKPEALQKAFGPGVTARVFSDAYSAMREDMVGKSAQRIPGFECGARPLYALAFVTPYPIKPGAVSWVEKFILDCKPRAQRNFLAILENGQPRMIELLPGATVADPQLQRDAFRGSGAAVVTVRPQGCDHQWVTETRPVSDHKSGEPWTERWIYDLCGTKAEVEMTFTPAADGGTDWTAKLVR